MLTFHVYRRDYLHMGESYVTFALASLTPHENWGEYVDTVTAQTGRDAAGIYFKRAGLAFPWGGMFTRQTGVYGVVIKHP